MNWIIEHIINIIPIWIWYITLIISLLSYIFSKFIKYLTIEFSALIILLFSIFMIGGDSIASVYQQKLDNIESKLKVSEAKSNQINTEIKTVYVDRVKIIHDKQEQILAQIQKDKDTINQDCTVSKEAVEILNGAAR